MKFVIHARSIAHVCHLIECEGEDADDALENYWNGGGGDVLGVQIGACVSDMDPMPDSARESIRGDYYVKAGGEEASPAQAAYSGRLRPPLEGESYRAQRKILGSANGDETTAVIESEHGAHVVRFERRMGRTGFVKPLLELRFESFTDAVKQYEQAEALLAASSTGN